MASNGVTRPPALDVTMQEILDALKAVSFRPQVIDNLTSQDSGAPLSANQGRVLKDAIDDLVTQSITDGDTSHAPSGDAVHDALNAISEVQALTNSVTWNPASGDNVAFKYVIKIGRLVLVSFAYESSANTEQYVSVLQGLPKSVGETWCCACPDQYTLSDKGLSARGGIFGRIQTNSTTFSVFPDTIGRFWFNFVYVCQ